MLLIAAVFVVTMIVWMNRVARHLKKEIEDKVEAMHERSGSEAGWAILFVFLMVPARGLILALILRAVELSSEGLANLLLGTMCGHRGCVAVGSFFSSRAPYASAAPFRLFFCSD